MAYNNLMTPKFKWFDSNGDPASGWKIYTYNNGTTTNRTSYDGPAGSANANPVVLDSDGEADIWLDGVYTIVLKDGDDVTQWTLDDMEGAPLGSVRFTITATLAAIGTGDVDGELKLDADTGNLYSWDDDNSKWRIQSGNHYTTANLPTTTYTIETGTMVVDTTVERPKRWDGSAWVVLSGSGALTSKTDGDSPYSISASEVTASTVFDNDGATARLIYQLPDISTVSGGVVRFMITDAYDLQVKADTSDTISFGGTATAANGYIEDDAVGNYVEIIPTADTWVITGMGISWDYDQ